MGLLSKKLGFITRELSADVIKTIFHTCLASETTTSDYPIRLKENSNRDIITFDWDLIKKRKNTIKYLLGQLDVVHNHKFSVDMAMLNKKYDGTPLYEETDKVTPIQIIALGIVTMQFSHIQDDNTIHIITTKATLSPFDPAYKAWWAEHRAEWEA